MDHNYRGTAVACGAALANAAAVASMRGVAMESNPFQLVEGLDQVEELLANDHKVPIGWVDLTGRTSQHKADDSWSKLGPFVNKRVTNRQKGPQTPLSLGEAQQLQTCIDGIDGVNVQYTPVDHGEYDVVLDAFSEADRFRMLDSTLHKQLFGEFINTTGPSENAQLGMDMRTLELSEKQQRLIRVLERADSMQLLSDWNVGERLREDTRKNLLACSGLVTVGVSGNGSFEDFVKGGLAMQRVWLTATKMGLGMQPWTPLFSYTNTFDQLSNMIGQSKAEILFPKARAAFDVLGFKEGSNNQFVIAFRTHKGPVPTAISSRISPIMMNTRDEVLIEARDDVEFLNTYAA